MWLGGLLLVVAALCCPGGGFLTPPTPARTQIKPLRCEYAQTYGMLGADCRQLNLIAVPPNLNTDLQVLDLTFNRIRELLNSSFVNYPYLRFLYLEDNSISSIEAGAFEPLSELEVLDMSWNSLHTVPDALHSLPVLRKLSMSRNLFASVLFLDPLPSVEELELSECRLKELPVLEALPRLLYLNISSNRIKTVTVHQLAPLCRLQRLDLRGNKQLFMRGNGLCDCTLLVKWAGIRHIKTIPPIETLCRPALEAYKGRFDNATCFNNETDLIFKESSLIARTCEVGVLEYGSGPIRIRNSVLWTLGVLVACAVLLVCFASVYFVRRRQRQFPHDDHDLSEENITITKSRS